MSSTKNIKLKHLKRKTDQANDEEPKQARVEEPEAAHAPASETSEAVPPPPDTTNGEEYVEPPPPTDEAIEEVITDGVREHIANGGVIKPFDKANLMLAMYARSTFGRDHVYFYKDFTPDDIVDLVTQLETREGTQKEGLKLSFKDDKLKYSAIQTPIGVLSFSTITFDGNRHESDPQLKPKTSADVKQSITLTFRAYCDEGRDKEDLMHDSVGKDFVKWAEAFTTTWFLGKLIAMQGKACVSKYWKKVRDNFAKDGNKNPTPEQLLRAFRNAFLLELVRRDGCGQLFSRFATKLLRKPMKNENFSGGHMAENEWLQEQWDQHGLILNDIPVYTRRSQAELDEKWPNISLYQKIPRNKVNIQNGDLGCVQFYPAATNGAGDKCAIMGYLKAIIWYGPGTELSKMRPEVPIDTESCPELMRPPELPGSECYMERFAQMAPALPAAEVKALPPAESEAQHNQTD
jgi:hypothetical protein